MYCGERCKNSAQRHGIARSRLEITQAVPVPPRPVKPQRKPSLSDLTALIVDAYALEAAFRFAAAKADHRFRPMCHRIADALAGALDKEGLR